MSEIMGAGVSKQSPPWEVLCNQKQLLLQEKSDLSAL
jgi:hypothetical protein